MRIDASILRKRQEEIKEVVRESSPVLVWPGDAGIFVVAANKSLRESGLRIFPVHDRMTLVMRGEFSSSRLLAHKVVYAAYGQIHEFSAEDVDPAVLLGLLGSRLAESYEMPVGPRVAAEAVLVRLEAAPDDDFIGLAECSGETERFEGPLWRGPDEKGDRTDAVQKHLNVLWSPGRQLEDVQVLIGTDPILDAAMQPRARLETVFLDRQSVATKQWNRVFRRLP